MRKNVLFLVLIVNMWSGLVTSNATIASDGIPDNCEYTDGAYYQQNLIPVYDAVNNRILLMDWSTGAQVSLLEEGLVVEPETYRLPVQFFNWSPDCHYLTASINTSQGKDLAIWDVITGTRRRTFENAMLVSWPHITWDSTTQYAFVETKNGAYLWKLDSNELIQLTYGHNGFGSSFLQIHWDLDRMLLYAVQAYYRFQNGVTVYDLNTGQEIAFYENIGTISVQGDRFFFSDDGSKLVVYTSGTSRGDAGATVWDLNSGTSWHIDSGHKLVDSRRTVAISPNNRYLAVGIRAIRVWDLQNLGNGEPIYRYEGPLAKIISLRFINDKTVETTDAYGVIQLWDLHTGEFIEAG